MVANIKQRRLITGAVNINNLLGFAFGVVFVAVMLIFATQYPNPTPSQVYTFIVVLALAAAGVGAILPGTLGIELRGPVAMPVVRAGGALAMFALVLFFRPTIEQAAIKIVPPTAPTEPVVAAYLDASDRGDINAVWNAFDPDTRGLIVGTLEDVQQIYKNYVLPLGPVVKRQFIGTNGIISPAGYPVGLYRVLNYVTKFKNDNGLCRGGRGRTRFSG